MKKTAKIGSNLTDFPAEIFHLDFIVWAYLRNMAANSAVRTNTCNSSSLANKFTDA